MRLARHIGSARLLSVIFSFCLLAAGDPLRAQTKSTVGTQDDPAKWIGEMAMSFHRQNYDGVLVSNRGGVLRTVRIVHIVRNGEESERIEYLDGEPLEILRTDHDTDCMHAGSKIILGSAAAGSLFGGYAQSGKPGLVSLYRLEVRAPSRVAGRAVSVLDVLPSDQDRYAHRLFLDQQTRLLLKSEVLDAQSNVLESTQFTQIKIGSEVDPGALETVGQEVVREEFHSLPMIHVDPPDAAWRLSWLPAGFKRASHHQHELVDSPGMVQSQHFTDGMALFSVFVESTKEAVDTFETRSGSTLAYVAPRKLNDAWVSVTVVGEVPLATAVKIAQGLDSRPPRRAADQLSGAP